MIKYLWEKKIKNDIYKWVLSKVLFDSGEG